MSASIVFRAALYRINADWLNTMPHCRNARHFIFPNVNSFLPFAKCFLVRVMPNQASFWPTNNNNHIKLFLIGLLTSIACTQLLETEFPCCRRDILPFNFNMVNLYWLSHSKCYFNEHFVIRHVSLLFWIKKKYFSTRSSSITFYAGLFFTLIWCHDCLLLCVQFLVRSNEQQAKWFRFSNVLCALICRRYVHWLLFCEAKRKFLQTNKKRVAALIQQAIQCQTEQLKRRETINNIISD